jgi:hypothetical protein
MKACVALVRYYCFSYEKTFFLSLIIIVLSVTHPNAIQPYPQCLLGALTVFTGSVAAESESNLTSCFSLLVLVLADHIRTIRLTSLYSLILVLIPYALPALNRTVVLHCMCFAATGMGSDAAVTDPEQAKWVRAENRVKEYQKEDAAAAAEAHKEDMVHWKAFQKALGGLPSAPSKDVLLIDRVPLRDKLDWMKGERAARRVRAFQADEQFRAREQLRFDQRLSEARRDAKDNEAAAKAMKEVSGKVAEPCPPLQEDCLVRDTPTTPFDTSVCTALVEVNHKSVSAYLLIMSGAGKVSVAMASGAKQVSSRRAAHEIIGVCFLYV